jgi:hypothetical protein
MTSEIFPMRGSLKQMEVLCHGHLAADAKVVFLAHALQDL